MSGIKIIFSFINAELKFFYPDTHMQLHMAKNVDLDELPERLAFEIKLQIALRKNATSIKENSKHPEKFDEYIQERENKIRKLLHTEDEVVVTEHGKVIFSSPQFGKRPIQKG